MTTMRVVGECFFWYRLTQVFPDKFHRAVKRLCVCVWCIVLPMRVIKPPKYCSFHQIFTRCWGCCVHLPLPIRAKFGKRQLTNSLRLHAKFHLNLFIVSLSRDEKMQFWQMLTFAGLLYQAPFTDKGQIWYATVDPWPTCMCQISPGSIYSVSPEQQKKTNFAIFWI